MVHLKLLVLGEPRLERDGGPLELNLRKALALLVYLAVSSWPHLRLSACLQDYAPPILALSSSASPQVSPVSIRGR